MTTEILSAVLGIDVQNVKIDNDTVTYNSCFIVSTDKLVGLMKEWVINEGWVISVTTYSDTILVRLPDIPKLFEAKNEYAGVTKACEWLLADEDYDDNI